MLILSHLEVEILQSLSNTHTHTTRGMLYVLSMPNYVYVPEYKLQLESIVIFCTCSSLFSDCSSLCDLPDFYSFLKMLLRYHLSCQSFPAHTKTNLSHHIISLPVDTYIFTYVTLEETPPAWMTGTERVQMKKAFRPPNFYKQEEGCKKLLNCKYILSFI